jgi:predicted permease
MNRFIFSFSIIIAGLSAGYIIRLLIDKKIPGMKSRIDLMRKILQKTALLFFFPISFLGAIWIFKPDDYRLFILPFIGVLAFFLGGFFAFLFAKYLKFSRRQAGSLISCGIFTNIGSIGALICFVFLGERGFAFIPFYKLFEELVYYGIGFPFVKSYGEAAYEKESFFKRIKKVFSDVFILAALFSIIGGFILNVAGIKRPDFYGTINIVSVPAGTILLLISIGMAIKFKTIKKNIPACLIMSLVKQVMVPVTVTLLAYLMGFGKIDGGMPLKVILILSSMPVAFTAMVPPTLYDLDIDLANSCWLFTTVLLFIDLPVLLFVMNFF